MRRSVSRPNTAIADKTQQTDVHILCDIVLVEYDKLQYTKTKYLYWTSLLYTQVSNIDVALIPYDLAPSIVSLKQPR